MGSAVGAQAPPLNRGVSDAREIKNPKRKRQHCFEDKGHDYTGNVVLRREGYGALILIAGAALSACDSVSTRFVTGLSLEQRALAAQLPAYKERLPEGSYELLGPVSGLSCQVDVSDDFPASEDGALDELKRATIGKGGNAVMGVRCETFSRGAGGHHCFQSFECRGDAVLTPSNSPR